MRVVAGTARGRRLVVPTGASTRPTADRVREATFNALGSLAAVDGASVLDLFAGSGALGIEALSRGAAVATFVDIDPVALAAVRVNLATAGVEDRASVVRADGLRWLAGDHEQVDLALLDPPYATTDEVWSSLMSQLRATLAVIESDRPIGPPPPWRVLRSRAYGASVVAIARQE